MHLFFSKNHEETLRPDFQVHDVPYIFYLCTFYYPKSAPQSNGSISAEILNSVFGILNNIAASRKLKSGVINYILECSVAIVLLNIECLFMTGSIIITRAEGEGRYSWEAYFYM